MTQSHSTPAKQNAHPDEVDLIELFQNLWTQKLLILLVTAVVVAGAAAYVFLATPVYQGRATVLPPQLSDIAEYNVGRSAVGLNAFDVSDIYAGLKQALYSEGLRKRFFREVYLPSLDQQEAQQLRDRLWERFNQSIQIRTPDIKNSPTLLEVSVENSNPQRAAEWANTLVGMASEQTQGNMLNAVHTEVSTRMRSLENKLAAMRASAEMERQDRILRLREALIVADAVGIDAPQIRAGKITSDSQLAEFMDGNLLYMRGAKAIRAELDVLEKRQNNDPFIPGLRDQESQLEVLRKIDINPENVAVLTIDSVAEIPETPIKPKRILILVLGLALGGMLGVLVALVRRVLQKRAMEQASL